MASGRNEHAQISSKLESETQTRTRLESEVRHVIDMMCIVNNREVGWVMRNGSGPEVRNFARFCFVLVIFVCLLVCLLCSVVFLLKVLYSHSSSFQRFGTYFVIVRFSLYSKE